MLHYAENSGNQISNLVNCGVYILSTKIYNEFEDLINEEHTIEETKDED